MQRRGAPSIGRRNPTSITSSDGRHKDPHQEGAMWRSPVLRQVGVDRHHPPSGFALLCVSSKPHLPGLSIFLSAPRDPFSPPRPNGFHFIARHAIYISPRFSFPIGALSCMVRCISSVCIPTGKPPTAGRALWWLGKLRPSGVLGHISGKNYPTQKDRELLLIQGGPWI